jgi:hypothetical protein
MKDIRYLEGAIVMKEAKKIKFVKKLLKKAADKCPVFPVLIMPKPSFPCLEPIPPFKNSTGA